MWRRLPVVRRGNRRLCVSFVGGAVCASETEHAANMATNHSPLWAVRVWEPDPPRGQERLEWMSADQ